MLILVGRRTVGEFRQIAFGDPETGLFGFVDHPDEGDLGQSAFLLGIAAADVRVDAGEPALLDILGLPLFGSETHWHKWLRLLPFGEAENAPAFVTRHGVAENPYRRIVTRLGQRLEARNPNQIGRAHV